MKNKFSLRASYFMLPFVCVACGAGDETCIESEGVDCAVTVDELSELEAPADLPMSERIHVSGPELGLGDRGPEVRALNDYLMAFGYFPNAALARRHARWSPLVPEAASDPDVFDENTERALLELQSTFRLETTGVLDDATRALVTLPRCGVPEGITPADPAEKFALLPSWTPGVGVSFSILVDYVRNDPVSTSAFRNAVFDALNVWHLETTIDFFEDTSGNGNIRIAFFRDGDTDFDGDSVSFNSSNGYANAPGGSPGAGDIRLNGALVWTTADTTPTGQNDLQAVILHELGHAIGLDHTPYTTIMKSPRQTNVTDRVLLPDDAIAASQLYDTWTQLPGSATQIDVNGVLSYNVGGNVNAVSYTEHAWSLGNSLVDNGYRIYKWLGSSWSGAATGNLTARRIAVSRTGKPWIVLANGDIYRRTTDSPTSGSWQRVDGACATDIDIGGDGTGEGSVWIAGCGSTGLRKLVGSSWVTKPGSTGVERVAVDVNGIPWMVTTGIVSRLSTSDPTTAQFVMVPSVPSGAAEIDANPGYRDPVLPNTDFSGYPFATNKKSVSGGREVWLYNQQFPGLTTPARDQWLRVNENAVALSVGPNGRLWIINSSDRVKRQTRVSF